MSLTILLSVSLRSLRLHFFCLCSDESTSNILFLFWITDKSVHPLMSKSTIQESHRISIEMGDLVGHNDIFSLQILSNWFSKGIYLIHYRRINDGNSYI